MNVPLRLGALLLVGLMIQVTVFVDVRFLGVAPELLSLVAIIGAFYVGPERGPVLAFGAGVVWDVYLPTPLGVTAITPPVPASISSWMTLSQAACRPSPPSSIQADTRAATPCRMKGSP